MDGRSPSGYSNALVPRIIRFVIHWTGKGEQEVFDSFLGRSTSVNLISQTLLAFELRVQPLHKWLFDR